MSEAILTFKDIDNRPVAGILFKDPLFGEAFFYDEYGNPPGRSGAPKPYYLCNYQDQIYPAISLIPPEHPRLQSSEIKKFMTTSPGLWLRECAIAMYQLEFPKFNLGGKNSQCQYDQKFLNDIEPEMGN